ncbi:MAG: 4Fe-4S dicluster domain-containing protein [Nitrospirota bacterium]
MEEMKQVGFYFDKKRCIKCHACEVACKSWNKVGIGPRWRTVVKVGSGKYPNVKQINVSLACMHCGTPPCRDACPVRAITKEASDGRVIVDQAKCIGCGFCVWACPFNAPQLGKDGKMSKCHFCPDRPLGLPRACEEICPTKAIRSGTMEELNEQGRLQSAKKLIGEEAKPASIIK